MRTSLLYGIGGGVVAGLGHFLFTSKYDTVLTVLKSEGLLVVESKHSGFLLATD